MEFSLNIVFDIIIAIVLLCFISKYYYEGLIKSIILFFSKFITFAAAFLVAGKYAEELSQEYIYDKIYGYVDNLLVKSFDFNAIFETLQTNISDANSEAISLLFSSSDFTLDELLVLNADKAVTAIQDSLVNSVSYGFTYIAIFIVMLVAMTVVFRIIISIVDTVFDLPILGNINKIGGAILGLLAGLFVSSMVIWTIMTVVPVTTMDEGIFYEQTIEDSYILKHICDARPDFIANFIY